MKHHHKTNWQKALKDRKPETRGSWTCNSKNSEYHFDNMRQDEAGDYYKILGKFDLSHPDVQQEINWITSRADWEQGTLPYDSFNNLADTSKNLSFSDRLENKRSSGSLKAFQCTFHEMMFPRLYELTRACGLTTYSEKKHNSTGLPISARVICQSPGHMFQIHIDDELWEVNQSDPSQVVRMVIMLDNWHAGQMYQYGNTMYQNWYAGEVHVFDWPNVPHSTANCSKHHRPSIQITGLKTPEYEEMYKFGNKMRILPWKYANNS